MIKHEVKILEEGKVTLDTPVQITTTVQELIRIYAVVGRSNGKSCSKLWGEIKNLIDKRQFAWLYANVQQLGVINYLGIESKLEQSILTNLNPESREIIELKEQLQQAEDLVRKTREQLDKLGGK